MSTIAQLQEKIKELEADKKFLQTTITSLVNQGTVLVPRSALEKEDFWDSKVSEADIKQQELEARIWVQNKVMSNAPKEGEVKVAGFWDAIIIEGIKQATITFAGEVLVRLKEKGIEWAIDLAKYALEKLQDFLFEKYQQSQIKEKEIFKNKIIENFPDSGLANKLKNG